jgi:hypothetical protein
MQPMSNSFYVVHGVLIGSYSIFRDLERGFRLACAEHPYRLKPFCVGAWKRRACQ